MAKRIARRSLLGGSALLFGAVTTGVAQTNTSAAPSDPIELLKLDGKGSMHFSAVSLCSVDALSLHYDNDVKNSFASEANKITAAMEKKDYVTAIGQSKTAAASYSYCFSHYAKASDAPIYAAGIGQILTMEAVSGFNGMMQSQETKAAGARARVLLNYAKSNGQEAEESLKLLDQLEPKTVEDVSKGEVSGSAQELVKAYQGNQVGFDRRYVDKDLQVTGSVSKIMPPVNGMVGVWITGIPKLNDRLTWRDQIDCEVHDPAAIDKATDLVPKSLITVVGKYQPDPSAFGAIRLVGCTILPPPAARRAPTPK